MFPSIMLFGMNDFFFSQGRYFEWTIQMFSSQFLHGGPMHLLMNAFFVLYFWNVLERRIGSGQFLLFFILCSLFLWVLITFLTNSNTIWMSGFALATLSYYTALLYKLKNPEYTGWVTAIVINIAIWFVPGVSFLGHLWGAVFWVIFYLLMRRK